MKFVLDVKGHNKKQQKHIAELVKKFCCDLPNQVAIDRCDCMEVTRGTQAKSAK